MESRGGYGFRNCAPCAEIHFLYIKKRGEREAGGRVRERKVRKVPKSAKWNAVFFSAAQVVRHTARRHTATCAALYSLLCGVAIPRLSVLVAIPLVASGNYIAHCGFSRVRCPSARLRTYSRGTATTLYLDSVGRRSRALRFYQSFLKSLIKTKSRFHTRHQCATRATHAKPSPRVVQISRICGLPKD